MKKLLIFLVLVGYTSLNYSQTLIQTFTDRCTGTTQVFQIAMTGTTAVVFYNRSQIFTAADVQSGVFQAWLEETYAWWTALNPCSAAQAEATTAQQTAQQTTQAATAAASNAASAAPPSPPTTNTASTNASSNTSNTASSSSADSTSSSQSTDSSSSSSSESSQGETSDSGGGGESSEDSGGGESSESESSDSEESSSEESSESESEEESSDESKEENKKEEDKKKERKRNLAPPLLAANVMTMQMLDGSWSTAASFGMSQSSLTGAETYSANAMIWTNFQQFSLTLSKSKVHFWSEYEGINYLVSPHTGKRYVSRDPKTGIRPKDRQNQIHHVGSTSFNYMNMFGTNVITAGYSHVILGQNDNFWKGFAGGYAAMGSLIILPESLLLSPSLTLFGTKPVAFKTLPRWGFAPMVAVSLTPIQLTNQDKQINVTWNEYFTYIIGTNVNFTLTQRFVANLGINTINNTNPIIPTTFAITIGARFAF